MDVDEDFVLDDEEVATETIETKTKKKSSGSGKSKKRSIDSDGTKTVSSDLINKESEINDVISKILLDYSDYKRVNSGIVTYKIPRTKLGDMSVPQLQSVFDRLGLKIRPVLNPNTLQITMNKRNWELMRDELPDDLVSEISEVEVGE